MSKEQETSSKVAATPKNSIKETVDKPISDDFIIRGNPLSVSKPSTEVKDPVLAQEPKEEESEEEDIVDPQDTDTEEDGSEPEVEETGGETEDSDSEVNLYKFFGEQLKKDGHLDDTFEVSEKVTGSDIYNGYLNKLKTELEPKLQKQITEQVYAELAENGVNQQHLEMAQMIAQGVDVTLLQNSVAVYERLSAFNKDATDEQKQANIRTMYSVRGYSEDEAEILIARAKDTEKTDELYATSAKFFEEKYKDFRANQNSQYQARRQAEIELVKKQNDHIRAKLSAGDIHGEKIDKQIAKEIEEAIYSATEIVEVNGKKVNMSKFVKFLNDFNSDPELRVYAYKKWAYRDKDLSEIEKTVEIKKEKEFLEAFKKSVTKDTKATTNQAIKKQIDNSKGKRTFYDFDAKVIA